MKKIFIDYENAFVASSPINTHLTKNEPSSFHGHKNFYEILYLVEGKIQHNINGTVYPLSTGKIVFLKKKDFHNFPNVEKHNCIRRDIAIKETLFSETCDFISHNFLEKYNSEDFPREYVLDAETSRRIEDLFRILSVPGFSDESRRCLERTLLVFLLQIPLLYVEKERSNCPVWLNNLITQLGERWMLDTPISDIIATYNYNPSYMRQMFKKYTGKTMGEVRLDTQLNYALSLLQSTTLSINEIAQTCGFNNLTYFYRAFKKKFGKTPRSY